METRSSRRWWILVVLCLSSLVLVVDGMALTVAVPQMTRDIGATAQDTQWILDSYVLVFAGLLLTSGSLGDRFGRRKVMIIGLLLFGAASLAAVFVANPGEMIGVRVAMGVGGALIMPSTLSILIVVFDEEGRRKAMAAWTSVAMLGLVGSPVLGGILIDHFSWHAIFFINIPVVVLAILAGLFLMPESKGPWQKPDLPGAVLSAAGMVALVWWIIGIPQHGAFSGTSLIPLAIAVAGLGGFVYWENVTSEPMVPLVLFRHRNFSGGSLSLALVEIANGGLLLVFTQYLQFVLGLLGLGAGLAMPAAVGALMSTIPPDKAGVGSALNDTIQQAGSALGIAILGSLLAGGFTRHMPAGAPAPARRSITGAFATAHGDAGLIHAAREAYTAAMSTTFTVGAIGVLAAAVLATLVIRNAKPEPVATPEHELVA